MIDDPDPSIVKPFALEKVEPLPESTEQSEGWVYKFRLRISSPPGGSLGLCDSPESSGMKENLSFKLMLERSGPTLVPVISCIVIVCLLVRITAAKAVLAQYEAM